METQFSFLFFKKKLEQLNKPPRFLEVMVLIFQFLSIFQWNENRFISLVLKTKEQKAIQLS